MLIAFPLQQWLHERVWMLRWYVHWLSFPFGQEIRIAYRLYGNSAMYSSKWMSNLQATIAAGSGRKIRSPVCVYCTAASHGDDTITTVLPHVMVMTPSLLYCRISWWWHHHYCTAACHGDETITTVLPHLMVITPSLLCCRISWWWHHHYCTAACHGDDTITTSVCNALNDS